MKTETAMKQYDTIIITPTDRQTDREKERERKKERENEGKTNGAIILSNEVQK